MKSGITRNLIFYDMILYGIKNCNTVKTAIDWLKKHKVEFEFHDYKTKSRSVSGKVLLTTFDRVRVIQTNF